MSTLASTGDRFVEQACAKPLLAILFSIAVIYLGFAAFLYTDYLNIGVQRKFRTDPSLGGIYFEEICVAILLGGGLLLDGPLRQRLCSRPAIVCYGFLLFYCVLGL